MNIGLVDHLVCPRCGPPFGLVLLAHEVRDRRVSEGEFGCPNCRDRFPVEGGFADLRPPPRGAGPDGEGGGGADGVYGDACVGENISVVEFIACLVGDGIRKENYRGNIIRICQWLNIGDDVGIVIVFV